MKVTFFHRKPTNIHFSIEFLFDQIRREIQSKNLETLKWIAPYYSTGFINRLKIILNAHKNQGDINHITGDINFIAFGLNKKRTILTIHDIGIINSEKATLAKWMLKTIWITLPIRRVSLVTVVSEETKKELIKATKIPANKIRVIGNIIPRSFVYSPKELNTSLPRILHIGSAPNKNLDRLIEGIQDITCQLIIIGYPTENQLYKLKQFKINYQIYSGLSQDELIQQYQLCDVLAFVSTLEGFGLPILEAQAIGRPIVTSNTSSMPEVAGSG